MSKEGKLIRGLKWNLLLERDPNGKDTLGIREDFNKMDDVNSYTSYVDGKNETLIRHLLIELRDLGRKGKRITTEARVDGKNVVVMRDGIYKTTYDKLFSDKVLSVKPKAPTKKGAR